MKYNSKIICGIISKKNRWSILKCLTSQNLQAYDFAKNFNCFTFIHYRHYLLLLQCELFYLSASANLSFLALIFRHYAPLLPTFNNKTTEQFYIISQLVRSHLCNDKLRIVRRWKRKIIVFNVSVFICNLLFCWQKCFFQESKP